MTKIAPLFWSFRSFSLILMQTPITITIESARFFETTIGVVRNALLYLLLLTMDCRERVRDRKKGRAKSLGLFGVDYFLMLYFVPSRDACNASTLASPSTVATLFSKLTSTFVTPGTFEKRSFTVLAHPAHLIPSKLYSFFIINLSFIVMLSSVLILGR